MEEERKEPGDKGGQGNSSQNVGGWTGKAGNRMADTGRRGSRG